MNYEKIIVELLARIQVLEEQVSFLMDKDGTRKPQNKISTADIRAHIQDLKQTAQKSGRASLILRAGDIHKDMGLKSCLPMVCNAMRQCMGENDIVVHQTASGYSSTLEIEYIF